MTATALPTLGTGAALHRARALSGMRLSRAARALHVQRSRLRAWESGELTPDADELARAIALYSADLTTIWPDRQPLVAPEEPGVLVIGDERVELLDAITTRSDGVTAIDNRVVLTRYLAAVRRQRGIGVRDRVELRAADIASLAAVLDVGDEALESLFADLLDMTPAGARWTTRAMVVGALMTAGATAIVGVSWFAPTAPGVTRVEAAAPPMARVRFSPAAIDPDRPVEAEVVTPEDSLPRSPFSTEPPGWSDAASSETPVELATAVAAVAPAVEWSPVLEAPVIETTAVERPGTDGPTAGDGQLPPAWFHQA